MFNAITQTRASWPAVRGDGPQRQEILGRGSYLPLVTAPVDSVLGLSRWRIRVGRKAGR
jgi:hypothetical protein